MKKGKGGYAAKACKPVMAGKPMKTKGGGLKKGK